MQIEQTKFLLLAIMAITLVTSMSYAYAQDAVDEEDLEDVTIGIEFGANAVTMGAAGAGAGLLLSVSKAIGNRLKNGKEVIDPRKLGLNLIVGAAIGAAGAALGLPIEQTLTGNFLALYVVNQFRPLIGNWISGKNQTPTSSKSSSSSGSGKKKKGRK